MIFLPLGIEALGVISQTYLSSMFVKSIHIAPHQFWQSMIRACANGLGSGLLSYIVVIRAVTESESHFKLDHYFSGLELNKLVKLRTLRGTLVKFL
jgi:hypothetical protein